MVKMVVEKAGFRTLLAENGAQAEKVCREGSADLVIMDVEMPVMDGITAIRAIRTFSAVPIILLTVRAEEDDLVEGFSAGAFDYLTKPFRPRELIARIQVLLQHVRGPRPEAGRRMVFGDLMIDPSSRTVTRNGQQVELTAMGYQILQYFMLHAGEMISKEALLRDVWAYTDPVGGKNMVEAAIKRLRKELQDDSREPRYIKTLWGVGYRLGDASDR